MRRNLAVSSAPSGQVVTDAELWDHLRVDLSGSPAEPVDADHITTLRETAETMLDGEAGWLGRALLTQTWDLVLDWFPACIEIPLPPLQSVSSIAYVDGDGATQTLSSSVYQVIDQGLWKPSLIVEAYQQSWPTTRDQPQAVTVTFVAGYGAASAVPAPIKSAIKLMVSHWYENREPVAIGETVEKMPMTVRALLANYRVYTFS